MRNKLAKQWETLTNVTMGQQDITKTCKDIV